MHYQFIANMVENNPEFEDIWDAMVAATMLTLLLGFVPFFLILVFDGFFSLTAGMWMQHRVQQYYFYFLCVFVLLITGIGSSLIACIKDVINEPTTIFWRIADAMPTATHFYLNFFPLQWAAHAGFLIRNAPLAKYLGLKPILGAERAKELAEPEAQCYYGIGSRSATFALLNVMAITFCTLSPGITVLSFIFFAFARIIYANLFLFSETPKPDLGGVFWVTSLRHTQQGLFIYVFMMSGVLMRRAPTYGPGICAMTAFLFVIPSYNRFERAFRWESLPFSSVIELGPSSSEKPDGRYVQEELYKDA